MVNILKAAEDEKIFDDLEYYTVSNAVENIEDSKEFAKLYSMLVNFRVGGDKQQKMVSTILPSLLEKTNKGIVNERAVTLAFLARSDDVIQTWIELERKVTLNDNLKKYLFTRLLYERRNCIYDISGTQLIASYKDKQLVQYLQAIQLCNLFNAKSDDDDEMELTELIAQADQLLSALSDFEPDNQVLRLYCLEVHRQIQLLRFLFSHSSMYLIRLNQFGKFRRILYDLLENVNICYKTYENIIPLVEQNNEATVKLFEIYNPNGVVPPKDDLEYYSVILCLKLVIDLLHFDDEMNMVDETFSQIMAVSKSVVDINRKLELCEMMYTILFLR